jgi:hypothetical protein
MVRSFQGAFFDQPGEVYADFPKFEQMERILAKAGLQKHDVVPARKITDDFASLWGKYLISLRSAKGGNFEVVGPGGQVILRETDVVHGRTLTVSDPLTGVPLWSRQFSNEGPVLLGASHFGNIVLMWKAGAKQLKEEEDRFPEIRARLSASAPDKDDELLEVVDLQSGRLTGSLLLDTGKGSYSVVRAMAAGDWVAVGDSANRTQVYSLARGVEIGKCFGEAIAMNLTDSLLVVQNGRGHLDLYNLDSMDRVDSYVFPTEIIHAQFSPAGNRLLVLTSQQIAYTLALDAPLISAQK